MELTDADAAAVGEYLMRGGFLMLDDFKVRSSGNMSKLQIKKILPEQTIKDLPPTPDLPELL
jgi:hypothetical protein